MLTDVPRNTAQPGKGGQLGFVRPLRPTLVYEPPGGEGWVHEIQQDGNRTIVVIENGTARAFTRNGHDWSDQYKHPLTRTAGLSCRSAILDGEMIVQSEIGLSDFSALRRAMAREPNRFDGSSEPMQASCQEEGDTITKSMSVVLDGDLLTITAEEAGGTQILHRCPASTLQPATSPAVTSEPEPASKRNLSSARRSSASISGVGLSPNFIGSLD